MYMWLFVRLDLFSNAWRRSAQPCMSRVSKGDSGLTNQNGLTRATPSPNIEILNIRSYTTPCNWI